MASLFEPGKIGNMELRNRLVKSGTFEGASSLEGHPTPALHRFHRRIVEGGIGLTIVAFAAVHPTARSYPRQSRIDSDESVPAWRELVDELHEAGGKVVLQLVHCGRTANPDVIGMDALAPSPVRDRYSLVTPREMTEEEIWEIIEAFGKAAGRAKRAGFDGVQIHAGHGYLISQFLSAFTNRRRDAWGGDEERRRRFLMEVYRRVRSEVGPHYPVLAKLNTKDYVRRGLTVEEAIPAARALVDEGIDAIELSGGFTDSVFNITRGEIPLDAFLEGFSFAQRIAIKVFFRQMQGKVRFEEEAYFLPDALQIRQAVPEVPVGLVGGMRSRAVMEDVLNKGFDFVSMGRPLIREPDLTRRMQAGEAEEAACISCNRCLVAMIEERGTRCHWVEISPES